MSKFYRTVGGEVYGKCGLTFAAEPVEVSDELLAQLTPRDSRTIGDRLAGDPRLVEVVIAAEVERTNAVPVETAQVADESADENGPPRRGRR